MRVILILFLLLELGLAKKVALVIGNSNYAQGYLANPINDAQLIRDTLQNDLDFDVTYETDLNKYKMKEVIQKFALSINKGDIALFYYSGHGMQFDHQNYLIPLNAHAVTEGQIPSVGVDVNYILGGMDKAKLAIVLLDACRNNPFRSFTKSANKGLAQTSSHQRNYIISYATEAGAVAKDGDGNNSPYALALNEYLTKPFEIATLLKKVKNRVATTTNSVQIPYVDDRYVGEFTLTQGNRMCSKVVKVPATYKTAKEYVLVSEATSKKVISPAKYGTKSEKIKISDGYRIYTWLKNGVEKKLEPELKTVIKRVLVSEGTEKYVQKDGEFKKVTTPPMYKTVKITEVVKEADISEIPAYLDYKSKVQPPMYRTVTRKVLVEGAKLKTIETPAKYKTITKKVLDTPETQKTISVPCNKIN